MQRRSASSLMAWTGKIRTGKVARLLNASLLSGNPVLEQELWLLLKKGLLNSGANKPNFSDSLCTCGNTCCPRPGGAGGADLPSRLVRVAFVARDKRGTPIDDLRASELEVRENGKVRPIVGLWRSDLPLSVVIVLDVSGSQIPAIEAHRRAIHDVLSHLLLATGEVTLVSFNSSVRLTVARTTSSKDIDDALMSVVAGRRAKNRPQAELYGPVLGEPCQGRQKIHDAPCGNSVVWRAVFEAATRLANVDGRKAIILLTDGDDSGSDRSLPDAIRKSQESETPVYCIAFRHAHGGRTNINDLKTMAEKTGGLAYEEGSPDQIWKRISADLQSTYVLAFHPGADKPGFHRVQLSTRKGHVIRTRPGYFLSH